MVYEAQGGHRTTNNATNQLGARLDYYPVRIELTSLCRLGAYLGLGSEWIGIQSTNVSNPDYYTRLSGHGVATGVGVDLTFFRHVGLSAVWNRFSGVLNSYSMSEAAKSESVTLAKVINRNPGISGSGAGIGVNLNFDF